MENMFNKQQLNYCMMINIQYSKNGKQQLARCMFLYMWRLCAWRNWRNCGQYCQIVS